MTLCKNRCSTQNKGKDLKNVGIGSEPGCQRNSNFKIVKIFKLLKLNCKLPYEFSGTPGE